MMREIFKSLRVHCEALPKKISLFEKWAGGGSCELVKLGKTDSARYESFSIQKIDFRDRNALYKFCDKRHVPQKQRDIVWFCFPGFNGAECTQSLLQRCKTQLIPKEGLAFVFHGPAAIAGYTPAQCIQATEAVKDAIYWIVKFNPEMRYRIFCFSAGTHLGFYIANQLGKDLGKPIDKLIALSPGESIAYGIFSTWVTQALAWDLESRGITKEIYHEAIYHYTQKANIEFLPSGRNLVIHAGTRDTFIPRDMVGGTDSLVNLLKKAGKNPTYVIHRGKNHVTLAVSVIMSARCGRDPYGLQKE